MIRSIITTAALAATLGAAGAMAQPIDPMTATVPRAGPAAVPAQGAMPSTGSMSAPTPMRTSSLPAASAATSAGVDASAMAPAPQTVLLDSSTPGATLVSSPPVPDTAENRARYGGPESNGGRRTAPAAN